MEPFKRYLVTKLVVEKNYDDFPKLVETTPKCKMQWNDIFVGIACFALKWNIFIDAMFEINYFKRILLSSGYVYLQVNYKGLYGKICCLNYTLVTFYSHFYFSKQTTLLILVNCLQVNNGRRDN